MSWIVVRNWEKFQHYGDARNPTWIKDYTEQTDSDEYRSLTLAARGALHGIRQEYAKSRRRLRDDTGDLTRRLGDRVLRVHIEALVHAGFIEISASAPTEQSARPDKRREDKKTPLPPSGQKSKSRNGPPEEPSPYAAHSKEPRLKAAEAWAKNGLLAELPPEIRERVLVDEFHISWKDAKRLVKAA